jgi:ADP-glucose pyrophosphorylase
MSVCMLYGFNVSQSISPLEVLITADALIRKCLVMKVFWANVDNYIVLKRG